MLYDDTKTHIDYVGNGKVYLIAGGGKCYTDIAARFVSSERPVEEIISSEYNAKIVNNILESGHLAATEFDWFIFGVEGYSRVCETQLVRKRLASYLIKSGRVDLKSKRKYDMILPKVFLQDEYKNRTYTCSVASHISDLKDQSITLTYEQFIDISRQMYDHAIASGIKDEDARYLKPQATMFKAILGFNCHGLRDWFKIRCCHRAQYEIRDLANKMLKLCKEAQPDLFKHAGANCKVLGYCPENKYQCDTFKDKIPTHEEILNTYKSVKEYDESVTSLLGEYKKLISPCKDVCDDD